MPARFATIFALFSVDVCPLCNDFCPYVAIFVKYAAIFAILPRYSQICGDIRKICGVSLQMGVAGNAPTVVAFAVKWVNFVANGAKIPARADTQVCPYNTAKMPPKPPFLQKKSQISTFPLANASNYFYIYPSNAVFAPNTPLARASYAGSTALCVQGVKNLSQVRFR
jgi:hypothetical protein